jgi:hypothetical protein
MARAINHSCRKLNKRVHIECDEMAMGGCAYGMTCKLKSTEE